jgi:Ca2+-binding EF-hand superfamily protein
MNPDANGNISVDELKDFVLELCEQDLVEKKLHKKDIEGFLSAFNYNTYGATNIDEVTSLVYTRDDLIQLRLAERKRANPPPEDLNKGISIANIDVKDVHNHRIKSLMNQMEDKVFTGKCKLYHVFRQFDKDKDGFISYGDFQQCLESIKVQASPEEVGSMMKLIDRNNKGYLSYTEFSQVFSPNMSEKLVQVPLKDVHFPNLHPNKEMNNDNLLKQTQMQNTIKEIRKSFQPDLDTRK